MTMTEAERWDLRLELLPEISRSLPVRSQWPARMRELYDALRVAGWLVMLTQGEDSGGSRYITLETLAPDRERKARVTWHSRATNGKTLRLFACMLSEPHAHGGWRDLTVKGLIVAAGR